ncbi:MAG: ABC transporter permease [Bacteroidales bacterium]|nr:ABC transporter permease [Bacteroidales bacterium]
MRKIWILTKREFITSVRTKSFLIGLIIAPLLMGGSFIVIKLSEDKVDLTDKKFAVIDHSGIMGEALIQIADDRNKEYTIDKESGEKIRPAYHFMNIIPDSANLLQQKFQLSEKVRNKELHAFVEIGQDVLHPGDSSENFKITYYAENSMIDDIMGWVGRAINNHIRQLRVKELNLGEDATNDLFYWINVEGMGLVSLDEETGDVTDARSSSLAEALAVPYIFMMLMFMMVMMFTVPLLSAVMEEKSERIAEVLLGSVSPTQFMVGKLFGSILVSLIGSSVYVIGGAILATQTGFAESIPYHLLPWFFVFMILEIIMVGSIMIGLGAACNNAKDAQSLQFPAMLPVILPMFVMFPILKDPVSSFSTALSLFPPFTPMLMIVRQATPVTIPAWQPYVGLLGVLLFTLLTIWIGGRIFRTCILMQGTPPKISNIVRWTLKG